MTMKMTWDKTKLAQKAGYKKKSISSHAKLSQKYFLL